MPREYEPRASGLRNASGARLQTPAKQKAASDRLRYLSHYDALTRLPNRAFIRNKLGKALRTATDADHHSLAVLFLSIDFYSRINETLGPAMGDRLVRCVAKRLKDLLGGNDNVGYWGSDKFVLLLERPGDESQVLRIVQGIKKKVERSFFSFKQEFFLTSTFFYKRK